MSTTASGVLPAEIDIFSPNSNPLEPELKVLEGSCSSRFYPAPNLKVVTKTFNPTTAELRNFSVPFDKRIISRYPGLRELTQTLLSEILDDPKRRGLKHWERAADGIVSNLWFAHRHLKFIAIPRGIEHFYLDRRLGQLYYKYKKIVRILDFLEEKGYISQWTGNEGSELVSRIFPTKKLRDEFTKQDRKLFQRNLIVYEEYEHLLILRDKDKKQIYFEPNNFTISEVNRLREYNSLISNTNISLCLKDTQYLVDHTFYNQLSKLNLCNPIDLYPSDSNYIQNTPSIHSTSLLIPLLTRYLREKGVTSVSPKKLASIVYGITSIGIPEKNQLVRIFNESSNFDRGGRLYWAAYQALPKCLRALLRIDGQITCELDYACLHPTMLYHLRGEQPPENPYLFDKQDPLREVCKLILLISFNADEPNKAILALQGELQEEENKHLIQHLYNSSFGASGRNLTDNQRLFYSCRNIYQRMLDHHEAISDKFGSGIGVELQKIDGDMASDILWHFTSKGVPVLCMHDSFIVPRKHKLELQGLMRKVYFEEFGYNIKVT